MDSAPRNICAAPRSSDTQFSKAWAFQAASPAMLAAAPTRFREPGRSPRRHHRSRGRRRIETRISRISAIGDKPRRAATRASCNGATPIPRRLRIGATHCAIRVQNPQSASKNSHPRAWRPFPSVNSEASEIMGRFLPCFVTSFVDISFPHRFAFYPAFFPSRVTTFPRSFTTLFSAPVGIRKISSNNPVMAVKNSCMLSNRSRV